MNKWLKKRFDRTYPQYGFLSEFQKTFIVLGVVLAFVFVPINPIISLLILLCSLFVPLYI